MNTRRIPTATASQRRDGPHTEKKAATRSIQVEIKRAQAP